MNLVVSASPFLAVDLADIGIMVFIIGAGHLRKQYARKPKLGCRLGDFDFVGDVLPARGVFNREDCLTAEEEVLS